MKFSTSSSDLLKKLLVVAGAIGSNPVLPILEDFLFSIEGDQLSIAATDLETSIQTSLQIEADKDGKVAVPGKILLETLKALPDQPITILVDDETFAIQITSAYGKYKLAGENGADFPKIPQPDSINSVELPGSVLASAITNTLFAASNDDLRTAIKGIFFKLEEGLLTFVATDAHKLVKYVYKQVSSKVNTSFIVPKKALQLLKGTLHSDEDIKLSFNKDNAFFNFGDVHLVCRLIDSKFPDYNTVIPKDNPNILSVNRSDFQNSLRRIAIYSNKTTNQVLLNISSGSLTISSQDIDFSNEASEQLVCAYKGDSLNIGFNAKFLIEMLNVLNTDEVRMELSTPRDATLILPSELDEEVDILMLLVPSFL